MDTDNDSQLEDPVLGGRGTTLASIGELNDVRRASEVMRIVDAKVQVEKDRMFLWKL